MPTPKGMAGGGDYSGDGTVSARDSDKAIVSRAGEGLRALRHGSALTAAAMLVVVILVSVAVLGAVQGQAEAVVYSRFAGRVTSGSALATTFVGELTRHEASVVTEYLAGPRPSAEVVASAAKELSSPAVVLLDGQGRLVQGYPQDPSLTGTDLAAHYTHLRQALDGEVGVSNEVRSAVEHLPVVAVAIPIRFAGGRTGVFSAGFDIRDFPLSAYLQSAFPKPTSGVYVVDATGDVIATTVPAASGATLPGVDGSLAAASARRQSGTYRSNGTAMYFVENPIQGTPWRLIATVPVGALRAPLGDQWVAWVLLGGFCAAGLVALILLGRLLAGRDRIAVALVNGRALEAQKSEFIASVSHDLRTPLTSVVGYTELLATSQSLSQDEMTMMNGIRHNAARLGLLIEDLLTVSQIQAGYFNLDLRLVDLRQVIADVRSTVAPLAVRAGVELLVQVPEQLTMIRGDRRQLERAITNVAANAVKFTPPTGKVTVRAAVDGGGHVAVVVSDTGIGIPPGEVGHIFDRFYRATTAKNQAVPGTGLGLAITKTILELHGGGITATSEVGVGTEMSLLLPLEPSTEHEHRGDGLVAEAVHRT